MSKSGHKNDKILTQKLHIFDTGMTHFWHKNGAILMQKSHYFDTKMTKFPRLRSPTPYPLHYNYTYNYNRNVVLIYFDYITDVSY